MLKNFLLVLVISIFTCSAFAQSYSYSWDKTYGGFGRDWNCTLVRGASNDIFLIGDSETDVDGDKSVPLCNVALDHSDIWLIKADSSGTILWQRNYGGEADERNPRLLLLNNPAGEMIFSCYSTSNIACEKTEPNRDTIPLVSADYWIALLDSNGMIIWEKTIGGDNYDDYTQIAMLSTGEFIVCGESNSPVGYDKTIPNHTVSNDLWVVKFDETGALLADYVFGGDGGEFLTAVIADDQGGFLLSGSTTSDASGEVSEPTQGNLDFWMIKVDNSGNKVWDKRFGGSGPDQCNHAIQTIDQGYLLCGFTVSPQSGDVSEAPKGFQDYWVVKTDSLGNKEWDKRYGGTGGSFGTWAGNATGNNYWIAGYSNSSNVLDVTEPSYGQSDYWILNIDSVGTKLFDKRFGGSGNEYGTSMLALNDTTFLAFGYSDTGSSSVKNDASKGLYDYWVVKFNYNDGTVGLHEPLSANDNFSVYPNPSNGILNLSFEKMLSGPLNIRISEVTGKIIYNHQVDGVDSGTGLQFDLSSMKPGLYFIICDGMPSGPSVQKFMLH